jgi:23S rRNA pseudouridine2604 synthase
VKLDRDAVAVDGKVLQRKTVKPIYIVFNKPAGLIGSKEEYRKTLYSFLTNKRGWYIPNGVLTKGASGIVIVTNDPIHKSAQFSPIAGLTRDMLVKVHRNPKKTELTKLTKLLKEEWSETADDISVEVHAKGARATWIKISHREGRIHDIMVALKTVGLEPLRAERSRIGPFTTESLSPGAWYRLTDEEILALDELVKQKPKEDNISLASLWTQVAEKFFPKDTE